MISNGQNTSLNNVKNIIIFNGKDTIKIDGDSYKQFHIKRSGLGSYVGILDFMDIQNNKKLLNEI